VVETAVKVQDYSCAEETVSVLTFRCLVLGNGVSGCSRLIYSETDKFPLRYFRCRCDCIGVRFFVSPVFLPEVLK
jgi:hypothetical protein